MHLFHGWAIKPLLMQKGTVSGSNTFIFSVFYSIHSLLPSLSDSLVRSQIFSSCRTVYKSNVFKWHKTNEFSTGCLNCAANLIYNVLNIVHRLSNQSKLNKLYCNGSINIFEEWIFKQENGKRTLTTKPF